MDKDVDACMEKLNKMEWGEEDERHKTALLLFGESADVQKVWSSMVSDGEVVAFLLLVFYWLRSNRRRLIKIHRIRENDSSGYAYTQDLMYGDPTQCFDMMRLTQEAFALLCNHFTEKNWLQASRTISIEEKMAIFLHVIGHNERFRAVKGGFHHSTQTIHQCFHEVLTAMMCFAKEIIAPTTPNPTRHNSERHRRLKNNFSRAIGALDGTLVHAVVPVDQQTCYRGRGKGECFQNGIAHDSRVLKELAFNSTSGFPFPPLDKYYLCDVAYTNTRGFMAPYRNTRYWLADFRRGRPLTREERFNNAHAQLRNVIERAYGVLKARFPILKQMAPYPFTVQRDIVIACVAIHNFIRKYNIEDELFRNFEEDTMVTPDVQGRGIDRENIQGIEWGPEAVEYMRVLRDQIANRLLSPTLH
ncbi:uncharacterized protein LOC128125995 [Lactuca sativa]|uniref:uncharacterized protein LOC128125995 n=1 Tax=Lactuca sativa TaxID=4236 RepID=UPI0022AFE090|nr:uncharacterized protein LOC128125995 [Lactuca sativa]